jgi:uncharacterized protein YrzB (UPF0473 family)
MIITTLQEEGDFLMSDHVHMHDENCDHEEVVILTDDEGNEREFIIVETMEVGTQNYAILVPADGEDEDGFIMRIETDEEGDYLVDIEDEEEWNRVVQAYEKLTDEA